MRRDLLDDRLRQEGDDDLQPASAVRAVLKVQIEDALEQPRPTQRYRPVVRIDSLALGGLRRRAPSTGPCGTPFARSLAEPVDRGASTP